MTTRIVNFVRSFTSMAGMEVRSFTSMAGMEVRSPKFFMGCGKAIASNEFFDKLVSKKYNVIFVGENHDDPAAHDIELDILKKLKEDGDKLGLSLEFWDREAQQVTDEYLMGLVSEEGFIQDSRPPGNYHAYMPLLQVCKEHGLPVVAANCPRRYTRLVAKQGQSALLALLKESDSVKSLLPSLPFPPASRKYEEAFREIMEDMGMTEVPKGMIEAQCLWDASMADSLHKALEKTPRLIHITGFFHMQYALGTVERLRELLPEVKILSVAIIPSEDMNYLSDGQKNIADLVVLTDLNRIE